MTRLRILIVEDETLQAVLLADIIDSLGHEVCGHASSGGGAIFMAERLKPDLMIADVGLDGSMDGIEVAAEVKKTLGISTIFISGSLDEETRSRAEKVGQLGFLPKPYAPESIRKVLTNAIPFIGSIQSHQLARRRNPSFLRDDHRGHSRILFH